MSKKSPKDLENFKNDFHKKKKVNSRAKGSAYERALAKRLNGRFNTTEFCRTPGSGAFGSTHQLPSYLKVYGDLITPENFKFVIEAKKGYNVTLEDLWRPKSDFYNFIKQASKDGKFANKPWLLIYKKDRKKDILICIDPFPIPEVILVKGKYYVYLLEDVLELDDSEFLT
jgi:hypothetical protein